MNTNEINEEIKLLAKNYFKILEKKLDSEAFLNIFNDKYNWFASLGLSEEDYQKIATNVKFYRDVIEKEFNDTEDDIVTANKVVYLEGEDYYKGFHQIVGTRPKLRVMTYERLINAKYNNYDAISKYIINKKLGDTFTYNTEQYQIQNIWSLDEFFKLLIEPDEKKDKSLMPDDGDIVVGNLSSTNFYNFFQYYKEDEDENTLIDGIDSFRYSLIIQKEDGLYTYGVLELYKIINIITRETFIERFNIKQNEKQKILIKNTWLLI